MAQHTFFCIDGHTCGAPVRLVSGGAPQLRGATQTERREHFMNEFDWIRQALMFEPRGHGIMSGALLYPPSRDDCDMAVIFIETSGCLAMCGHGTIGTVTFAIEHGLVTPATPGIVRIETPAGLVTASYQMNGAHVTAVKITNVPSFLLVEDYLFEAPELGQLKIDVAYGGNFYPIVEAQENFADMGDYTPGELLRLGRLCRDKLNNELDLVHPENPMINGCKHWMWTGAPTKEGANGRNATIYGDQAIDRSPCGTGTSARLAQREAKGQIGTGEDFVHESIIGSLFVGRVEDSARVGDVDAIIPSIEGSAWITGLNTIFVDDRDPFHHGFQVI
jgi:4-hydroxyproline epimerase